MTAPLRVLLLEDRDSDAALATRELKRGELECETRCVKTEDEFRRELGAFAPDIVLADYSIPGFGGIAALEILQSTAPLTPLIVVTGSLDEETAAECIKAGAADYVLKTHLARLGPAVRGALAMRRSREDKTAAEGALRASEQRFRALVEHSWDAIALYAADGTILYGSPATTRILGYELTEFVGRNAVELVHSDDREAVVARLTEAMMHPRVRVDVSARVLHKDGSWRYLEGIFTNLLDDPSVGAIVNNYRDVTERRSLQEQVMQPKVLDLNALVLDIEKLLRRLIGEDILLASVLDRQLGHVRADPGQLQQVILNLAVNARDAMPGGGRLTIETRNVDLHEQYADEHRAVIPGRYVLLAVRDTGAGMDAETQAHLFEPFFTTKGLGKGTGLGLATVYGIVKQSGGHIWVDSELGHGTTFKIYLPRVDEPAEPLEEPSSAPPARLRGTERILLVEDEAAVRAVTRQLLQRNGYDVIEAPEGTAALALLQAGAVTVDLLLTDVVMPGMGGRELAQRVVPRYPGLRVLFMSGYTDDAVVRHSILEDGVNYLQKPFHPEALLRKVREVLDGPR